MTTISERSSVQQLSNADFAALGLEELAFVRQVKTENGEDGFGIFAANGQTLGVAPSRDLAFAAAKQHELEPLIVH